MPWRWTTGPATGLRLNATALATAEHLTRTRHGNYRTEHDDG